MRAWARPLRAASSQSGNSCPGCRSPALGGRGVPRTPPHPSRLRPGQPRRWAAWCAPAAREPRGASARGRGLGRDREGEVRPWPLVAPLAESGSSLQIRTGFSHHHGRCVRPIHSCHPAHKVTDAANNGGNESPGSSEGRGLWLRRWAWRGRERGAATLPAKP